jgi:hypothetical protein
VEARFFALTGGLLPKTYLAEDGVLRVDTQHDPDLRRVARHNDGATELDLRGVDRILVVGFRFGLGFIQDLLAFRGVLEWHPRPKRKAISRALYWAAVRDAVAQSVGAVAERFRGDQRVTLAPAPYPAACAAAPGPKQDTSMAHMRAHPQREAIFARYEAEIAQCAQAAGLGLALQPRETLDGPFATQDRLLRDASAGICSGGPPPEDTRHMNETYGLAALNAFAALRLGQPSPS